MKTRFKTIIIVIIVVVSIPGIIIFGPILLMIATNAYSGSVISMTPDSVFEEDFGKISEVNFFIEKYPMYTTNHLSDFLGWKIINYDAEVGKNVVHLSVKKSVLHQGVKISAGCSVNGPHNYALNILDDAVMDYLKSDSCLEKSESDIVDSLEISNTERDPTKKYLLWCASEFDFTKQEFNQGLEDYVCDTSICSESEPPLFSSALNDNVDFIERGCANFVDKWAYLTDDNDFTWHHVHWESFVEHHYHSDPISDPQRNQKCADLFDLIMLSVPDSDLWYELTETNDFVDARCASIVEEWEDLTEHNVWDIRLSWNDVSENAK